MISVPRSLAHSFAGPSWASLQCRCNSEVATCERMAGWLVLGANLCNPSCAAGVYSVFFGCLAKKTRLTLCGQPACQSGLQQVSFKLFQTATTTTNCSCVSYYYRLAWLRIRTCSRARALCAQSAGQARDRAGAHCEFSSVQLGPAQSSSAPLSSVQLMNNNGRSMSAANGDL